MKHLNHHHSSVEEVLQNLIGNFEVLKATKYHSPTEIIRGVRKTFKAYGRKPRQGGNIEITLTLGKPNYVEREFIKLCQKLGEPFPVKKVQLKIYNPKPKNLKKNESKKVSS